MKSKTAQTRLATPIAPNKPDRTRLTMFTAAVVEDLAMASPAVCPPKQLQHVEPSGETIRPWPGKASQLVPPIDTSVSAAEHLLAREVRSD